MTGWVALLGLVASALLILWRSRMNRALWPAVFVTILLATTGYAFQNRAALPGHPVAASATALPVPDDEIALRNAMLGRSSVDWAYLILSDGLFRTGRAADATGVILAGLNQYPRSLSLWTGLGSALARYDGGQVSPAARLAFARAARLNPLHPAPHFFAGLAYVRAGELATARAHWARALALTPRDISYRRDVEARLALLDRFIAETAGAPPIR